MTAFAVALLYLASILPAERMGIVAVSSLFGIAAVIEAGIPAGVFVFLGGSLIGWLLVPYKPVILLYALFLGYYPVVKSLAEKLKNKVLQWAVKLAVFNLAFTALWFLFSALVFGPAILKLGTGLVYPVGNLVFILYDIGLTRLIGVYIVRISKNLRKNKE
ncbi:hypothetical protein SAMN02745823_00102 [Sporobacter termitidis DSM 10068]|uniref:Biotin transporter n=2 Tax=Sporobacter TaxID=44748 RepID=A0A1M5TI51_9FIRM|nr:hypothetical protein SAMN02745823_00102 [Sporobacter termitidis DSM 10068]